MKRYVIDSGCKNCDACYWACPRKAIRIVENERAEIEQSKCSGCGICYKNCANEAISVYELTEDEGSSGSKS